MISQPRARAKPGPKVGATRGGVILTHELIERICAKVAAGQFASDAAAVEWIPARTFFDWVNRGEKEPGTIFEDLRVALEQAEAESSQALVNRLGIHSREEWKAAAFLLQKRHEKWNPKVEPVPVVAAPTIDFSKLNDEELAAWRKLYAKAKPT